MILLVCVCSNVVVCQIIYHAFISVFLLLHQIKTKLVRPQPNPVAPDYATNPAIDDKDDLNNNKESEDSTDNANNEASEKEDDVNW